MAFNPRFSNIGSTFVVDPSIASQEKNMRCQTAKRTPADFQGQLATCRRGVIGKLWAGVLSGCISLTKTGRKRNGVGTSMEPSWNNMRWNRFEARGKWENAGETRGENGRSNIFAGRNLGGILDPNVQWRDRDKGCFHSYRSIMWALSSPVWIHKLATVKTYLTHKMQLYLQSFVLWNCGHDIICFSDIERACTFLWLNFELKCACYGL